MKVAEEIEEAMKGDGNDLDNGTTVEAPNKKQKTPEEEVKKDLPETKNMIYYVKNLKTIPKKDLHNPSKQCSKETQSKNTNLRSN